MNASEAISELNALSPNRYDDAQKRLWLHDLDGRIEKELGMDTAGDADNGAEAELLVPAPWARDVYVNYLRARVAQADAEAERYNLYAAGYNSAYAEFAAWFIRTRQHPGREEKGWMF